MSGMCTTYELPFFICGRANLVIANIWIMLLWNVLDTLSKSISAKSSHIICFEALLTRTSTRPYLLAEARSV